MKIYRFDKETLTYKRIKFWRYVFFVGAVVALLFTLTSFIKDKTQVRYLQAEKEILLKMDDEFTEEKFLEEVKKYNFRYPDVIIAQAKIESANFSSPIFKEGNNLFGMKEAKSRLNLANGTLRNHAYYNSWKESLQDRALYEASYTHKIKSKERYIEYLDRLYAEDGSYAIKLRKAIGAVNH